MLTRCRMLALLYTALTIFIGCGVSTNVQNPPTPPESKLSIAFDPMPPASIPVDQVTDVSAVVSDDPGNYGVDWSLSCNNSGKCGSLSALHTASGQVITYTPPPTLPGNNLAINIVAFAAADHTRNQTASIDITAFGSGLIGTYVFQAKGLDINFQPYQLAGVIVLDGNGGVSSGEQIYNSVGGSLRTAILDGSHYFLGADGRGVITLKTSDQQGNPISENFSLIVLSGSKALIAELDAPQSSSGTMELQTSTSAPAGSYAFAMSGTDPFGTPTGFGGIVNIDSPGNISGAGSLADQDYNLALTSCSSPKGLVGTVSSPDATRFNAVLFNVTGANCFGTIQLTGYPIDGIHFALIESDNNGSSGFSTSGSAISQGSSTGTYTTSSFNGTYVFGVLGTDFSSGLSPSLISVGTLTADGAGTLITGVTDTFLMSDVFGSPVQIESTFDGTYTVDTQGIGRVRLTLADFDPAPHPAYKPALIFYLTGNGQPALVLNSGGKDLNYPSQGIGVGYPRATGNPAIKGDYGVSFTRQNGSEDDGTGHITVDPAANPSITGLVDDTNSGIGLPTAINDSLGAKDAFGRIAGTFLGSPVRYYPIDSTQGLFVETDFADPIVPSGQITLGSYAARAAAVCAGCR